MAFTTQRENKKTKHGQKKIVGESCKMGDDNMIGNKDQDERDIQTVSATAPLLR